MVYPVHIDGNNLYTIFFLSKVEEGPRLGYAHEICVCPRPTDSISSHEDSFFRSYLRTDLNSCADTTMAITLPRSIMTITITIIQARDNVLDVIIWEGGFVFYYVLGRREIVRTINKYSYSLRPISLRR